MGDGQHNIDDKQARAGYPADSELRPAAKSFPGQSETLPDIHDEKRKRNQRECRLVHQQGYQQKPCGNYPDTAGHQAPLLTVGRYKQSCSQEQQSERQIDMQTPKRELHGVGGVYQHQNAHEHPPAKGSCCF